MCRHYGRKMAKVPLFTWNLENFEVPVPSEIRAKFHMRGALRLNARFHLDRFIGTARVAYAVESRRYGVRLSVPAWTHISKSAAAGLLLWARSAGDIDRCSSGGQCHVVRLSAYVGNWRQTSFDLFNCCVTLSQNFYSTSHFPRHWKRFDSSAECVRALGLPFPRFVLFLPNDNSV